MTRSSSILIGSYFISTSILAPLKLKDEDALSKTDELSSLEPTKDFYFLLVVNPTQKQSQNEYLDAQKQR